MLTMKAVEIIEKRYLDTGEIENNEIMGLIRTIRVQDKLLQAVNPERNDSAKDQISIFRDGNGKIIATERTINISEEEKKLHKFSRVLITIFLLLSAIDLILLLKELF